MKGDLGKRKMNIINAARQIVAQRGVANTTLQAIADEAGISKGALYYHYNSKSAILYDLMDETSSRAKTLAMDSQTKNLSKDDVAEAIKEIFNITVSDTPESRLFIHLVYEAVLGDKELKNKFEQKYEQWVTNIEEILVTVNNIPKSNKTRLMAVLIEAAVDGIILKNLIGIQLNDNEQVLDLIGELNLQKIADFLNE